MLTITLLPVCATCLQAGGNIHVACTASSKHIPVNEIPERLSELPEDLDTPICCFCKIGQRSGIAKRFLEQVGYANVVNGISLENVAQTMDTDIVQS
jgi:rhodanese-related sulfurtransferase